MYFSLLMLGICLVIFLFTLFLLTHDDFVLLRKNISQEQVFNIAILSLLFGLLCARLLYAFLHLSEGFFHPLIFLAFPYFSGFSILGGVVGTLVFLFLYTRKPTIPTFRLLDFFSLSFIPSLAVGFVGITVRGLIEKKSTDFLFVIPILYIILGIVFIVFLVPLYRKGEFKDGSISCLFLTSFALISLLIDALSKETKIAAFLGIEGIISLIIFVTFLILLIKQENLISDVSKIWSQK